MKNLNKFTKAELISKFKKLEIKNSNVNNSNTNTTYFSNTHFYSFMTSLFSTKEVVTKSKNLIER